MTTKSRWLVTFFGPLDEFEVCYVRTSSESEAIRVAMTQPAVMGIPGSDNPENYAADECRRESC